MPQGAIDISVFGDKALERKFARLGPKLEKKIMRPVLRKAAKRIRPAIAQAAPVDTGRLKAALATAPIRSIRSRTQIRIVVKMPERDALGIPDGAKGYYPYAIEYGCTKKSGRVVAARSYIRATVDARMDSEHTALRRDIQRGIIKEAKKK